MLLREGLELALLLEKDQLSHQEADVLEVAFEVAVVGEGLFEGCTFVGMGDVGTADQRTPRLLVQLERVYFEKAFGAEVYFVGLEDAKVDLVALLGNSHANIDEAEKDIHKISIFEHLIRILFVGDGVLEGVVVVLGQAVEGDGIRAEPDCCIILELPFSMWMLSTFTIFLCDSKDW